MLARNIYEELFYEQAKAPSMLSFNKVILERYLRKQICIGRAHGLYSMAPDFKERKQDKSGRFGLHTDGHMLKFMLAFDNNDLKAEDYHRMSIALDMLTFEAGKRQGDRTRANSVVGALTESVIIFATGLHSSESGQPIFKSADIACFEQRIHRVSDEVVITLEMIAEAGRPSKVQEFYKSVTV